MRVLVCLSRPVYILCEVYSICVLVCLSCPFYILCDVSSCLNWSQVSDGALP